MTDRDVRPRLTGELPKIGIKPVIDGRRNGVRESLEEPVMRMARSVAELIGSRLRHSCGLPVECVIADTTIAGAVESAACAEKFRRENVGAIIHVTRCWCYAAEIMDMDPTVPRAIWGFNGTKKPGAVYLAGSMAVHDQKGIPAYKIYGRDVQDENDFSIPPDVEEKLLRFARASVAVATMKGKSYLSMGGVSMGIGGSIVDPDLFQSYFAMRNEYVDMTEFVRRMERGIYDNDEFTRALAWTRENCREMEDPNPPEIRESRERKDHNWETSVKMTLIAGDLMAGNEKLAVMGFPEEALGHNAIAAGFQGQRHWTDHFPNGDFMEAILNSSFDWNGPREPFIVATENDSLNALSMLFGHLLTGTAQIFADVRTFWSAQAVERVCGSRLEGVGAGGFLYLTNSGAAALDGSGCLEKDGVPVIKSFRELTGEDVKECMRNVSWGEAKLVTFRGGGFSSSYRTRGGMPMTMSRLNLVKSLGPVLQIAQGYSIDLPVEIETEIVKRTDPTWPRTFFVPHITGKGAFRDVYTVMNRWGSNHCALSYGHIGADLITLASMLRIPVAMHNIDESGVFRPASWDSFGTVDAEDADFRACSAYGPLYGAYR